MPTHGIGDIPLFDDNPAVLDLLGYGAIATAVTAAVTDARLDPITVGVNAPWGGGKSTILRLIKDRLATDPAVVVVDIDPWEFADSGDPRGTLITRVIDELQRRVIEHAETMKEDDHSKKQLAIQAAKDLGVKLNNLRKRIVWSKVATTVIKSAVTFTPDIGGLVDSLTPKANEAEPGGDASVGMSGFREDFKRLLAEIPSVNRIVVLVDDLDRCLPLQILGSLEAIKLFLSVERMAFVLAADEDLIRAGLSSAMDTPNGQDFAARYTEKIVQLPFSLPRLSKADAEAYVALLLCGADPNCKPEQLTALAAQAMQRRAGANAPYVTANLIEQLPTSEHISQADAIAAGLKTDEWSSPRAIKRFLNNFAVRAQIARAWGAPIDLPVLMKLWIMEHRHRSAFNEMAKLSEGERPTYLGGLEADKPSRERDETLHRWARSAPLLSEHRDQVSAYLTLAAAVITNVSVGGALTQPEADLLRRLLDDSPSVRTAASRDFAEASDIRHGAVLVQIAKAVPNPRQRESALASLQTLIPRHPEVRSDVISVLLEPAVVGSVEDVDVPALADMPEVLQTLIDSDTTNDDVKTAARDELANRTTA